MDRTGAEPDLQLGLLERGVTIEYDLFGYEQSHTAWEREPPSDSRRIRDFIRLIDEGFRDQLVVAQVEENAVTLKRFFKEKDRIRLQPANPDYPPQFYDDVRIQGKLIGVIRRLD
jgi:predicted metal-dependent phosphotriesterase family hydrolase